MKTILLTSLFLFMIILPAKAVKKIEANPINIAISIVEKTDSMKIASILEYYGYAAKGKENGYQVMTDSKGNEILFSFPDKETHRYPTVILKGTRYDRHADSRLKELNFEKVGHYYERLRNQYSRFITQCKFEPDGSMLIRRKTNQHSGTTN